MAADPVTRPPGVTLKGGNWFHDGWLFGLLGLDPRPFDDYDNPVRDADIDAWHEGYDMARETDPAGLLAALTRVLASGQVVAEVHRR